MPTSSITKEFIITDVKAFIKAIEQSIEWNEKNPYTPIEYKELSREEIRELFGGDAK